MSCTSEGELWRGLRVYTQYRTWKYNSILELNTLRVTCCLPVVPRTVGSPEILRNANPERIPHHIYIESSVGSIYRHTVYQQARYCEYSWYELYNTRDTDTLYHPRVSIEPKLKHAYNASSTYREYALYSRCNKTIVTTNRKMSTGRDLQKNK